MKPTQSQFTNTPNISIVENTRSPATGFCTVEDCRQRATYLKPSLEPLGALNQIVRGASAKGVDCAGELDLSTYPF